MEKTSEAVFADATGQKVVHKVVQGLVQACQAFVREREREIERERCLVPRDGQ